MANLSFLSTLTEQQRQYAEIIRERAQAMGIPPDLAVAVAFQESRLNPASPTSRRGAVGIMQVRPIAAQDIGVDPEKLQDPSANIDAGLRYLKKALTETGDPRLAVIYYNAGPQRLIEFDRGGDLPKETQDYLLALKGYGAFRAEPPAEPASEPSLNRPEPPSAPVLNRSEPVMSPEPATEDPFKLPDMQTAINAQERRMAELVGLGAGTAVAAGRAGADVATKGLQAAGQAVARGVGQAAPSAGPSGAPVGLLGAPAGSAAGIGAPTGSAGAPIAGGAPAVPRATGFNSGNINYGTTFGVPYDVAQKLSGMSATRDEAWDVARKISEGQKRASAIYPGASMEVSPISGLATVTETGGVPRSRTVYRQSAPGALPTVEEVVPPAKPAIPKVGPLEQVTQTFKRMADTGLGMAGRAMRYVAPPLAMAQGAGELISAKQAMQREQPDYLEAALRGLGGTAAVASAFTPAALPVAVGAPLAQAFRERMAENARRFPADTRPLTPEEEERASRPVTFYRTGDRRFASRP
jgi:hypothetical protein